MRAGRALWLYFCEWVTLSLILSYAWKFAKRVFEEAVEALLAERQARAEAFDGQREIGEANGGDTAADDGRRTG